MSTVFNLQNALLFNEPETPTFQVEKTIPLSQALAEKQLEASSRVLYAQVGTEILAFSLLALVHHHVAQGQIGDLECVVSFCALCNAGTVFDARLDGQIYHFAGQGYYDAMVLLADQESQSYWNHLTGTAIHGSLAGKKLEQVTNLMEMTAADLLHAYPHAQYALDSLSPSDKTEITEWEEAERLSPKPTWDSDIQLVQTLSHEDKRLARHTMGLGIWTAQSKRYYPIQQVYQAQNLLIDELDGRKILVYIDPHVALPMAFYCDSSSAEWHGDSIQLSGGQEFKRGILYQGGQAQSIQRPSQNAMRWHGFSALFPNCEIYGQA